MFRACTYITLRCRGITQSYIEMLVEVIWPVIPVSLKHLVNLHFCRTIINLFNSTVYTQSSSIPLRSEAFFCLIETALLEVVKNTICCSQISPYLIIKNCDSSHVYPFSEYFLRLHSWARSGAELWGAGTGNGASALKLLTVIGEQTVTE